MENQLIVRIDRSSTRPFIDGSGRLWTKAHCDLILLITARRRIVVPWRLPTDIAKSSSEPTQMSALAHHASIQPHKNTMSQNKSPRNKWVTHEKSFLIMRRLEGRMFCTCKQKRARRRVKSDDKASNVAFWMIENLKERRKIHLMTASSVKTVIRISNFPPHSANCNSWLLFPKPAVAAHRIFIAQLSRITVKDLPIVLPTARSGNL